MLVTNPELILSVDISQKVMVLSARTLLTLECIYVSPTPFVAYCGLLICDTLLLATTT